MIPETDAIRSLRESMAEIDRLLRPSHTQTVTIHGGAVSLVVSMVAVFAIVFSMAAVAVIWAWRDRDLDDMAQIRARLMQCEQYREQHGRRIADLEAKRAE